MPEKLPVWTVWHCDDRGRRLQIIETVMGFTVSRIANNTGYMRMALPPSVDPAAFGLDHLIEFWYRPPNSPTPMLFNVFFCREFEYSEGTNGADIFVVSGPDLIDLLDRRIVAYAAGSAQAEQTDNADDMIKEVVRDNLGADAAAGRNLSSVGMTVNGNTSQATSITKAFSWRNVLAVCQDIAGAARANAEDVFFWFEYTPGATTSSVTFTTSLDQPGRDRTAGASRTVFGREFGNLNRPTLIYNYITEANYIYGGGQGEGAARLVEEVYDLTRVQASAWNRREAFADARNSTSAASIQASAGAMLADKRPRLRFNGALGDTEQTRYGVHWAWGDKVEITYRGIQLDALVRSVQISVNTDGSQTIEAYAESTETLTGATVVT